MKHPNNSTHIMVRVPEELKLKAKSLNLNMSAIARDAIEKAIKKESLEIKKK